MSSVIHLETDKAREVAKLLDKTANEIQNEILSIGGKLRGLSWQSPARDAFISEYGQVEKKIIEKANEGINLGIRVQNEVDEWEQAAMALTAGTVSKEQRHQQAVRDTRKSIEDQWKNMSTEERIKWLEDWYKEQCKKLGIPPVDFNTEDLPDPEGKDYGGYYHHGGRFGLFRNMTIDIDNIKDDDPFDVMETIAHETRHEYQHYLIEHPDKRPSNISEEQVNSWKENFENYIDYEEGKDNFEAYEKQPVEADAFGSQEKMVDEYVSSRAEVI